MLSFAIIGVGYIAEKHLQAIRAVGGRLIAAFDIQDSVGILDKYFPDTKFFTNYDEFEGCCKSNEVDFLVICAPNFKHFFYCEKGHRLAKKGIICEKPIVFHQSEYEVLQSFGNIYQICQYRVNSDILHFKKFLKKTNWYAGYLINYTHRGDWYFKTWKGDKSKSGGLAFNIGIHIFDLLTFLFGRYKEYQLKYKNDKILRARIIFENADIHVYLSIDSPITERVININNHTIDLADTFGDLHPDTYKCIINNKWYTLDEFRDSFDLTNAIANEEDKWK